MRTEMDAEISRVRPKSLALELGEMPGSGVPECLIRRYSEGNKTVSLITDMVERRFGPGAVSSLLKRTFNPTVMGVDASASGYKNVIDEENRRIEEERRRLKGVCLMIEKLFGEGDNGTLQERPLSERVSKKCLSEWICRIAGKSYIQRQNDN